MYDYTTLSIYYLWKFYTKTTLDRPRYHYTTLIIYYLPKSYTTTTLVFSTSVTLVYTSATSELVYVSVIC